MTGVVYAGAAVALGALFLLTALRGFVGEKAAVWGRRLFLASLLYLPVLFTVLVLDPAA
jgi:heme O synthase-like polyprenyltransferase